MSLEIGNLKNLSGEQFLAQATDRLPPWVALILVLAIAWQLVRLTWLFFPQSAADATAAAPVMAAATRPAATTNSYDVSRIGAARLFGEMPATTGVEAPRTEDFEALDETQLSLTLRGTIAATDPRHALAIIADDRGEEKVYAVGDPISGGRKLHSVLPDRAILNNNGDLEALKLPQESEGSNSTTTSRASRVSARSTQRRPTPPANQVNPAKLTDLIRPQPVFSNGKQLGYRVYPGRRRQQFVSLGLKPGDLVTEINGTPLDDPAKGAEIFRSLADSNQVTVTVERNGTPQVLTLDTDQLNMDDGR